MKRTLLAAGMLLVQIGVQADTLYRWVDQAGKVHYGEHPDADAVDVVQKRFVAPDVANDGVLPYQTRQARQNFPVTLFVQEHCAELCAQARAYLNKRGIPFDEKALVTQKEVEEFRKTSGSSSVPTLGIGKSFLQGFEPGQWGSELDIAGYPQVAPYGVRPIVPPSPKAVQAESAVSPAAPAQ